MENSPQSALYNLLVTRDFDPELLDSSGKAVDSPDDAELFSFDWKTANKNYGTVVILTGDDQDLQMFFGDNLGRTMEGDDKKDWYDFLQQVKQFATRNLLKFEIKDLNKLKYTMQGMSAIKEGLFEGYYGNKKYSYSDQPKQVKLVIKHNKTLGEGDKRFRHIESIFVETADGERFKVPSCSTMHGKMLARHVSEGGNPYDTFGQHITEIVTEMATLAKFVRATKHKNFAGNAKDLAETAIRHYTDLKAKAKRIISQRGYHKELECYDPAALGDSEQLSDSIRNMFIEQSVDPRIEEAMPILTKLSARNTKMKEANEFESWANNMSEGTWSLPDNRGEEDKLIKLMSAPMPVGADATNATEQLYDLVGDDELFDILSDIAEADSNANIWEDERVINRLEELGVDTSPVVQAEQVAPQDVPYQDSEDQESEVDMEQPPEPTSEDLDTDGVMMTRPSNMSSESVERVLKLAQLLR